MKKIVRVKKKNLIDILVIGVLLLFIGGYFISWFFPEPKLLVTPDFSRSDSLHIGIAGKFLLSESLRTNQLPLWTPLINSGYSLLGEGQTGMFFVPNLILYKLFAFPIAFNLNSVLALIILAFGTYIWFKSIGFQPLSALFAALTITFSGITIPRLTHQAVLQGLSFLPWVMWATLQLFRQQNLKWMGIFALIASQQLLTGFTQTSVVSILFAGAYIVFLSGMKPIKWKAFILFFLAVGLTAGLSALHILPAQQYISQTYADKGLSLSDATRYSFSLNHLLTFVFPFWLGDPQKGTYPTLSAGDDNIFWENAGYIGIIPLFFILYFLLGIAKMQNKEKTTMMFFALCTIGSLLLMLGKYSPLYLLYSFWPLNQFRVPARFIWIFVVSLTWFSTFGFDKLLVKYKNKQFLLAALICFASISTMVNIYLWRDYHLFGSSARWLSQPEIIQQLSAADKIFSFYGENTYEFLFNKGWSVESPFYFMRNAMVPNSNLIWNVRSANVISGRLLRRQTFINSLFYEAVSVDPNKGVAIIKSGALKLFQMQGVTKVVSTVSIDAQGFNFIQDYEAAGLKVKLYEVERPLPRAYFAKNVAIIKTLDEAEKQLVSDAYDPNSQVLIEETLPIAESLSDGVVDNIKSDNQRISISVNNKGGTALLVLTDSYYPGWKATLDNQATNIYPANLIQRGVVIPQGEHVVEFRYEPDSLKYGLRISAVSLFIIVIFLGYPLLGRLKRSSNAVRV